MKKELAKSGVKIQGMSLSHANWAAQSGNIAATNDLPLAQDTKAANVWDKMATPSKEYVWVFDKNGVVVSFFKPWEMKLSNAGHYAKLKQILVTLAK